MSLLNDLCRVRLLYGAAGMTTFAAFIEAFWSSMTSIPPEVKYAVGIAFWILFAVYFFFAGRNRVTDAGGVTRTAGATSAVGAHGAGHAN